MDAIDAAALVLRLTLGVVFILHGANHAFGPGGLNGTAGWFAGLGMRHPRLQAINSAVVELGAGTLLLLGLMTPLASAAIIGTCLVAAVTAHRANGFFVFRDGYEYVAALALTAFSLALIGAGKLSLDELFGWSVFDGGIRAGLAALAIGGLACAALLAVFWRPSPASSS